MDADDFFVPDEPVDEVRRAFEQGRKRQTKAPAGRTIQFSMLDKVRGWTCNFDASGAGLLKIVVGATTEAAARSTH